MARAAARAPGPGCRAPSGVQGQPSLWRADTVCMTSTEATYVLTGSAYHICTSACEPRYFATTVRMTTCKLNSMTLAKNARPGTPIASGVFRIL